MATLGYQIISVPCKKLEEFLGLPPGQCIFDLSIDKWTEDTSIINISIAPEGTI